MLPLLAGACASAAEQVAAVLSIAVQEVYCLSLSPAISRSDDSDSISKMISIPILCQLSSSCLRSCKNALCVFSILVQLEQLASLLTEACPQLAEVTRKRLCAGGPGEPEHALQELQEPAEKQP